LVAPVRVGDNAANGAGSTITRDVADGGLTLSGRTEVKYVSSWERPQKDKA